MIFDDRINKLRQKLSLAQLEGMYVTNLTNVRYLTGFTGSAGSLLILEEAQHFFTDGIYMRDHGLGSNPYMPAKHRQPPAPLTRARPHIPAGMGPSIGSEVAG